MFASKNNFNILGVMNGTSIDGVDYVLCSWSDRTQKLKVIDRVSKKFTRKMTGALQVCAQNNAKVEFLATTHFELGRMYAKHISDIQKLKSWKISYVAIHGQTVFHKGGMASLQIGEVSFISKKLGIPTIFDFRSGDIALGGQGAPLAGLFHEYIYKTMLSEKSVAFHNLGGISNLTFLEKRKKICFDTGPGNMLMDLFIKKQSKGSLSMDRGGKIASKGLPDEHLLAEMLKHSYFKKPAPKSCGRENFGEIFLQKHSKQLSQIGLENALATLNLFTAKSIFNAYKKELPNFPDSIYLCGGGAENKHLVKNLGHLFAGKSHVKDVRSVGIGNSDMEAMAFAYLGVCFLKRIKLDLPSHTGAAKNTVLGKLSV